MASTKLRQCNTTADGEAPYSDGHWVARPTHPAPYVLQPSSRWTEDCDRNNEAWNRTGSLPSYARYAWEPRSCELAPFNAMALCAALEGQTLAMMGDSITEQFVSSLRGMVAGNGLKLPLAEPRAARSADGIATYELCKAKSESESAQRGFKLIFLFCSFGDANHCACLPEKAAQRPCPVLLASCIYLTRTGRALACPQAHQAPREAQTRPPGSLDKQIGW